MKVTTYVVRQIISAADWYARFVDEGGQTFYVKVLCLALIEDRLNNSQFWYVKPVFAGDGAVIDDDLEPNYKGLVHESEMRGEILTEILR